jgi:bisphosphoglycerate-dependent phosphoglycerate mutase
MSEPLPVVYLARHGETPWNLSVRHTGLTDLPLTDGGQRNPRRLAQRLKWRSFTRVFISPLQRAVRTCELAGFGAQSEADRDLLEWDYGEYEGRAQRKSMQTVQTGSCFTTVVREASYPGKSARVLTVKLGTRPVGQCWIRWALTA